MRLKLNNPIRYKRLKGVILKLMFLICFLSDATGQEWNLDLFFNSGISKVTTYPNDYKEDKPSFSLRTGIEFNDFWSENLFWGSGLNFIHYQNKVYLYDRPSIIWPGPNGGLDTVGFFDSRELLLINNFSIPLFIGLKLKSISVKVGLHIQYNISMTNKSKRSSKMYGEEFNHTQTYKNQGYGNFDIGPTLEVGCFVNPRTSIVISAYRGMIDISSGEKFPFRLRYGHLGVNYKLIAKE